MSNEINIDVEFPEKLEVFDLPSRYKFARGGRGSGKSWGVARKLLIRATEQPIRVLCTREVQDSIKESVHALLKDQITALQLGGFFKVLNNEIRGKNGSQFLFSGLSDQTAESIKSFESIDICWIEEGQTISANSLKLLKPTIRAENSEIWVTYNPKLESDPIHQLATTDAETAEYSIISIEMNYYDNPWFPDVLEQERLTDKKVMSKEDYEHTWEGRCLPAVEGAIYFDEVATAESQGRICPLSYDPMLKAHTIWDLGFNDSMFIIFVQRIASEIRIIKAIEDNQRTLPSYVSDDIQPLRFNWGKDWLPHDGFAVRHQSGKSDATVLRAMGRDVAQTPNMDVESGIRRAREVFPHIWFNSQDKGVQRLLECLRRYRRHVSKATNEPSRPVHDEYSHGADCFRYLCINADQITNVDDVVKAAPVPTITNFW